MLVLIICSLLLSMLAKITNRFRVSRPIRNQSHRIRVSVIRREIYQCCNWYGSDLQTLEDQAHQVLKKFYDLDLR